MAGIESEIALYPSPYSSRNIWNPCVREIPKAMTFLKISKATNKTIFPKPNWNMQRLTIQQKPWRYHFLYFRVTVKGLSHKLIEKYTEKGIKVLHNELKTTRMQKWFILNYVKHTCVLFESAVWMTTSNRFIISINKTKLEYL